MNVSKQADKQESKWSVSSSILATVVVSDVIVRLSGGITVLYSVLIEHAHHVENDVAREIGIEHRVHILEHVIFVKLSNGEGVGVAASNQANTVDSHEGTKDGCSMDEKVVEEAQRENSEQEGNADCEAPETCLAVNLVHEGVIKEETNWVTTHGSHNEDADSNKL